ncbi:hypothetical protein E2C01_084942 [Portunus trituberculatus]|uniref:Uncharacterized protein n=1 Tax=Portunus trituberculatus TaxID=210409 RepID=A0A5B7J7J1_PORTR|nr:hypothetical protein [Portunus trituberculatus]
MAGEVVTVGRRWGDRPMCSRPPGYFRQWCWTRDAAAGRRWRRGPPRASS